MATVTIDHLNQHTDKHREPWAFAFAADRTIHLWRAVPIDPKLRHGAGHRWVARCDDPDDPTLFRRTGDLDRGEVLRILAGDLHSDATIHDACSQITEATS